MTSVIIDKRYRGPPNSGNGGYVCGRLARHIPGGAEVTLRAPPPLDKRLMSSRRTTGHGSFAMAPQLSPSDDRQIWHLRCWRRQALTKHPPPNC